MTFTGITVTIQPQSESCSVTASATLDVGSTDPLTLSGTGTITAGTSPGLALTISVASWANAFGIDSLTLDDFGLSIGVEDEGVTVGFIGSFDVGQQFTFTAGGELIDFETPGAVIFSLDSDSGQTLMLSDLLTQFTTVDLSNVPILDSIGFTTLDFYAVDDPNGFVIDGYTFPAGIGITASVVIDTWAADLNLQIGSGSLIASGSISEPITIGAVFTLSDSAGTNGPSASINTTQSPYFTFDGQVSFLGISTAVTAAATISTFEFNVSFAFVATVTATLACQLVSGSSFSASTNVSYNLATTIGPIQEKGYTIIPQTAISTSANVTLSLSITTSGATLSGTLAFSWSGQSWNPSFTLTAADIGNDLTNVASALESWLANNAASVFAGLTAPAWTQIVASQGTDGFGGLDGIAPILAVVFGIPAASGAALLQQLGFGFTDVVDALTSYFGETYSAAVAVAEALFGSGECQTETAADLAYGADSLAISTRELRFALTSSPRGRELLTAYYEHAEEVWSLLDANPFLRRRLEALERSRRGASDLDRLGDAVIRALTDIAGRSSPRLRETIAAVLPELARYRTLTHAELLAELQQ